MVMDNCFKNCRRIQTIETNQNYELMNSSDTVLNASNQNEIERQIEMGMRYNLKINLIKSEITTIVHTPE